MASNETLTEAVTAHAGKIPYVFPHSGKGRAAHSRPIVWGALMIRVVARLARFGISGGLVTLLCYSVYLLCVSTGWNYLVANLVAWFVGLVASYQMNKRFTFRYDRQTNPRTICLFALIYVGQLLVGTSGLSLLVEVLRMDERVAYLANLIITASFSFLFLHRLFGSPSE